MKRLALAIALLSTPPACRHDEDAARAGRLSALQKRQAQLWERLNARVEADPVLALVLASEGEVLVGMRSGLLRKLVTEVAARYLDRVALDLKLDAKVAAQGDIHVKKAMLGDVTAGTWHLELVIHRVRGVLGARTPVVDVKGDRTVTLELPVSLDKARGKATIHFAWDSKGMANVLCHDFEVTRTIDGTLLPDVHSFKGGLVLTALDNSVLAQPTFKDVPYRLKVDLTPEAWKDVEAALNEQDSFFKCGIGIDPDKILPKLREILLKGFDVRLPKKLFRSFALPASLARTLEHDGRRLALTIKPDALRFSNDALWYSSAVSAQLEVARR